MATDATLSHIIIKKIQVRVHSHLCCLYRKYILHVYMTDFVIFLKEALLPCSNRMPYTDRTLLPHPYKMSKTHRNTFTALLHDTPNTQNNSCYISSRYLTYTETFLLNDIQDALYSQFLSFYTIPSLCPMIRRNTLAFT